MHIENTETYKTNEYKRIQYMYGLVFDRFELQRERSSTSGSVEEPPTQESTEGKVQKAHKKKTGLIGQEFCEKCTDN